MAEPVSPPAGNARVLRFACSCASAVAVADDPWVAVAQQGKLNDGTKELILNILYRQPRTITQLAQQLGLSAPTIHRHITDLLTSDLIREAQAPGGAREWAVERYYRPNFPVILAADRQALAPVLEELAGAVADAFRAQQEALTAAIARTDLPGRGDQAEDLLHYLYTAAVRLARARLEADGNLPPWPRHGDGSRWVWWAEEVSGREDE